MKIVKISDLSDEEKEKWQEQVIARQEEKENFMKKETEEANRLFNINVEATKKISQSPLPTQMNKSPLNLFRKSKLKEEEREFKIYKKEDREKDKAVSNMIVGPIKDIVGLGKLVASGASMGAKQVPYYLQSATQNNFGDYKRELLPRHLSSKSVNNEEKAMQMASRPIKISNDELSKDMSTTQNRLNALSTRGNNTNLLKNENNISNLPRLEKGKISTKEDIEKSLNSHVRHNVGTNLVEKGIRDSIIKDQDNMQEEQSKLSNPIAQKLGDIAPSVGQMLPRYSTKCSKSSSSAQHISQ